MHKNGFGINNLQGLMCLKTESNQTKYRLLLSGNEIKYLPSTKHTNVPIIKDEKSEIINAHTYTAICI